MNCRASEILFLKSLDSSLPAKDEYRLAEHMRSCPACRNFAADVHSNSESLASHVVPLPDLRFTERIAAGILSESNGRFERPRIRVRVAMATGLAAAALIFAAMRHTRDSQQSQSNPPLVAESGQNGPTPSLNLHPKAVVGRGLGSPTSDGRPKDESYARGARLHAGGDHEPYRYPSVQVDDIAYLNSDNVATLAGWSVQTPDGIAKLKSEIDRSVHGADDFVRIEFPRIAGAGASAIRAAMVNYRTQKQIVDTRLARKVTLAVKGVSLDAVCRLLSQQTQLDLKAMRAVSDEKVTIFCEDLPAREVMRGINRVFGFDWARLGEAGAWRYELDQDFKSRLLEEELCSRDLNEALLTLDERMQKRAQESRLKGHSDFTAEIYANLSTSERVALRNGQTLLLSTKNGDPAITPTLKLTALKTVGNFRIKSDGAPTFSDSDGGQPLSERPDAAVEVGFRIAQTELGELTLQSSTAPRWTTPDGTYTAMGNASGFGNPTITVRSAVTENPENAEANKALRREQIMQRAVNIETKSGCPSFNSDPVGDRARARQLSNTYEGQLESDHPIPLPHAMSGDAWEAIHAASRLPIIADSYTRLYPLADLQASSVSLFDGLSRVADKMGARWSYLSDSKCILGKTLSWFWDKRKEIPNRLLERWEEEKRRTGSLSLKTITEMASLSDAQLDSVIVMEGIRHCRGLSEMSLVTANSGGWRDFYLFRRRILRALSTASPTVLARLTEPAGVPFKDLELGLRGGMIAAAMPIFQNETTLLRSNLRIDYVPSGQFAWYPEHTYMGSEEDRRDPITHGRTEDETLAEARKRDAQASRGAIHRSGGLLGITVITAPAPPDAKPTYYSFGKPIPGIT